eukprot:TRINITY_DN66496_c3_g1_i1.p1 TRINITY_DN66496_c3_g1~~TRINITY_DN66496_c3_g1_i1.p1  ORF type:complete len:736 (-),score=340.81 TRINITY_DN66496_c3_g1_i1:57-2264(-)
MLGVISGAQSGRAGRMTGSLELESGGARRRQTQQPQRHHRVTILDDGNNNSNESKHSSHGEANRDSNNKSKKKHWFRQSTQARHIQVKQKAERHRRERLTQEITQQHVAEMMQKSKRFGIGSRTASDLAARVLANRSGGDGHRKRARVGVVGSSDNNNTAFAFGDGEDDGEDIGGVQQMGHRLLSHAARDATVMNIQNIDRSFLRMHKRTVAEYDAVVARKNVILATIGAVSIALSVAVLQLGWDGLTYDPPPLADTLKAVNSALTVLLLWRLYDYYQFQMHLDRIQFGVDHQMSLRHSPYLTTFLLEVFICILHPPPYLDFKINGSPFISNKFGIFLFLRVYLIGRVIRDRNDMFHWRKQILASGKLHSGLPEFDSLLAFKSYFYHKPWTFVSVCVFVNVVCFAYCIYVVEREVQPETFKLGNTIYFTCVSMTTLGYGDMVPKTDWGRFVTLIAVLVGMALAALIVAALIRWLRLSLNEHIAADLVANTKLELQEKRIAASMIQTTYRMYRERKRAREHPPCCTSCGYGKPRLDKFKMRMLQNRKTFRETRHNRMVAPIDENDFLVESIFAVSKRMNNIERLLSLLLLDQQQQQQQQQHDQDDYDDLRDDDDDLVAQELMEMGASQFDAERPSHSSSHQHQSQLPGAVHQEGHRSATATTASAGGVSAAGASAVFNRRMSIRQQQKQQKQRKSSQQQQQQQQLQQQQQTSGGGLGASHPESAQWRGIDQVLKDY